MADIFTEVDEALKRERAEQLWKAYGPWLVAGALAVVLATAVYAGYRSWTQHVNTQQTSALLTTLDKDEGQADALIAFSRESGSGPAALALLTAAGKYAHDSNWAKAYELYQGMTANSGLPDVFRDYAAVQAAITASKLAEKDRPDPAALLKRLDGIAGNGKSPWRLQAGLQAAVIAAHQQKDYAKAREYLKPLLQDEVSGIAPSLRQNAQALDHVYSLQQPPAGQTKDEQEQSQ